MKLIKLITALSAAALLSACASAPIEGYGGEAVTRAEPSNSTPQVAPILTQQSANWSLADVRVRVSGDLSVSEANRYYPVADIVWRGDAYGERRAQVAKILDDGITRGLRHLDGSRPVYFDIQLHRFHSLTEKARAVTGGVHNIKLTLTVVDAATGVALHGPVKMEVDLKAYGGEQALIAERQGLTQKVRIESHLAGLMRKSFPGGKPVQTAARQPLQAQDIDTGTSN